MNLTRKIRMPVDILMTILSLLLMGGTYLFSTDIVHEILGAALFIFSPIMQTFINCSILICTVFLMISGIILSNHLFIFLGISSGLGFARIAHLLASHWYYLFMSMHIGLHVSMIANKIKQKKNAANESSNEESMPQSSARKIIFRIFVALACAYGIYAFITRGVWKYLILQQQFFFFDLEKGYILFALDYLSIIILFATLSHLIATSLKKP